MPIADRWLYEVDGSLGGEVISRAEDRGTDGVMPAAVSMHAPPARS